MSTANLNIWLLLALFLTKFCNHWKVQNSTKNHIYSLLLHIHIQLHYISSRSQVADCVQQINTAVLWCWSKQSSSDVSIILRYY